MQHKIEYWAPPVIPRLQGLLFPICLDDVLVPEHLIRYYWKILKDYDWSAWEAPYDGVHGRPPIHPSILAGCWIWGLRQRIRSSRRLEYAIRYNTDLMWLAEGRLIDHSTLSKFRKKFSTQLNDLFKYINRRAMVEAHLDLSETATDGTRIKANASRYKTWTPKKIEEHIQQLANEFGQALKNCDDTDECEGALEELKEKLASATTEDSNSSSESVDLSPAAVSEVLSLLPALLKQADETNAALPEALTEALMKLLEAQELRQRLQAADKARKANGTDIEKSPAQIPKTDTDSSILPNKEGGFAPNYTPTATTSAKGGFIIQMDVIPDTNEGATLAPAMDEIKEDLGQYPNGNMSDGGYASGPNIVAMQERGIEFLTNISNNEPVPNCVQRDDPTQPIPESSWAELPINPQSKTIAKSAFVYSDEKDVHYCPAGHPMAFSELKKDNSKGQGNALKVYQCNECAGCPLKDKCILPSNKKGARTVSRDVYEKDRRDLAKKMQLPESREKYKRRMGIAERTFALIKQVLGLRQFLLRGLENVKTEWCWTCVAVNLDKLARLHRAARLAEMAEGVKVG